MWAAASLPSFLFKQNKDGNLKLGNNKKYSNVVANSILKDPNFFKLKERLDITCRRNRSHWSFTEQGTSLSCNHSLRQTVQRKIYTRIRLKSTKLSLCFYKVSWEPPTRPI